MVHRVQNRSVSHGNDEIVESTILLYAGCEIEPQKCTL